MKNVTTNPATAPPASTRERTAADAVVAAYIHEISEGARGADRDPESTTSQSASRRSKP